MKSMYKIPGLLLTLLLISSCEHTTENGQKSPSSDKDIIKFWFDEALNPTITGGRLEGVIDQEAQTIYIELYNDSPLTSLVPRFEVAKEASVFIEDIPQESGITPVDFTTPQPYQVVAQDGTLKRYQVTVNLVAPYSQACDLQYINLDKTRFYPTSDHTIYLRTSEDLSHRGLEYSISEGATLTPDLSKPQDLTQEIRFAVIAQDGKTQQEYTLKTIPSQMKLSGGDIQILGWNGIPNRYTSVAEFRKMKEAGFDVNLTHWYPSKAEAEFAIECAAQVGMKLIFMCPELVHDLENTAAYFKDKPGFYGYHLSDEPAATRFEALGKQVRAIQAIDPNALPYNNMFPNIANQEQLSGVFPNPPAITYQEYITRFDAEIASPIISFDYYPLVSVNDRETLQPSWFENLEEIATLSEKVHKPMWAFALSTPHWSYKSPTIASLRMQVMANLAYGAKCIQYFTYWTPDDYPGSPFYTAPINSDGTPTPIYDTVQQINKEIKAIAPLFANAKRVKTRHTGLTIPQGTHPLTPQDYPPELQSLDVKESNLLFALLEDPHRRVLLLQNTSPNETITLGIQLNAHVKRVLNDGYIYPLLDEKEITLHSGEAALYILN